jgi:hypothetical protein
VPVAAAVIPLVGVLIQSQLNLVEILEEAAREFSTNSALEKLEKETQAELEKTHQAIKRVTDSIADGVLTQQEAREKLQELREKKERLLREIQGFEEQKNIRDEILQAVQFINGNLEDCLWRIAEEKPEVLGRIMRFIFKPRSVVIESFWDSKQAVPIKTTSKKRGRIVTYELRESFAEGVVGKPATHPA